MVYGHSPSMAALEVNIVSTHCPVAIQGVPGMNQAWSMCTNEECGLYIVGASDKHTIRI